MRNLFLWAVLSFFSSGFAIAQSPAPSAVMDASARRKLLDEANQLYQAQRYQDAIERLKKLAASTTWANSAVFYNLGNAYFRLQRYGQALAAYRRAQRLRPHDEDLLHNIQLVYQKTGHSDESTRAWQTRLLFWYHLLNLRQLFWLAFFSLAFAFFLWALLLRREEKTGGLRWWAAAVTLLALLLLGSLGVKHYNEEILQTGIITKNRVTARSGYGDSFEALFILQEADEVVLRERTAGWVRIEIRQDDPKEKRKILRSGWIPDDALQTI